MVKPFKHIRFWSVKVKKKIWGENHESVPLTWKIWISYHASFNTHPNMTVSLSCPVFCASDLNCCTLFPVRGLSSAALCALVGRDPPRLLCFDSLKSENASSYKLWYLTKDYVNQNKGHLPINKFSTYIYMYKGRKIQTAKINLFWSRVAKMIKIDMYGICTI